MSNNLELVFTSDGSATLFNAAVGENYHSKHGAFQESQHVFVESGLQYYLDAFKKEDVSILEIGFGTGLNFLLSAEKAIIANIRINYTGVEKYPVPQHLLLKTEYGKYLKSLEHWNHFLNIYDKSFDENIHYLNDIYLENHQVDLLHFNTQKKFDLIYFDAFAAVHQPEMWTKESIEHTCSFLKDKGIFVTYSVTGELKRNLKSLGFEIQRPAGAAGKREMMRAIKY